MAVKHNSVLNVYYFILGNMFRPLAGHHQAYLRNTDQHVVILIKCNGIPIAYNYYIIYEALFIKVDVSCAF